LFSRSFEAAVVIACLLLAPERSYADGWPSRPITLVVAFPPSTTTDYAARAIAQDLSTVLGQPVVVEDRTGGGGVIASQSVAKAPPDGYTLLMTTIGPAVLRPLIDTKLHYDAVGHPGAAARPDGGGSRQMGEGRAGGQDLDWTLTPAVATQDREARRYSGAAGAHGRSRRLPGGRTVVPARDPFHGHLGLA
jgi:Tripartite tricarboxylate transporter family receptor